MQRFRFGKNSRKRMESVRKELVELAFRVLYKSEHDFGIPRDGGVRTAERQNELYNTRVNGKRITKCDGYKKLSVHQKEREGDALDIFLYVAKKPGGRKRASWDCPELYEYVADLFKLEFQIMQNEGKFGCDEQIEWGGDWRWKDLPHFQITKIKEKVENDK